MLDTIHVKSLVIWINLFVKDINKTPKLDFYYLMACNVGTLWVVVGQQDSDDMLVILSNRLVTYFWWDGDIFWAILGLQTYDSMLTNSEWAVG